MKEIIELEKTELYKLLDCLSIPMFTNEDLKETRKTVLFGKERKTEQIPETYEELRSLCIDISTKGNMIYIFSEWNNPNKEFLQVRTLRFYPDGTIRNDYDDKNNEPYIIVKNRTPQQMWQIIKSLIGEE